MRGSLKKPAPMPAVVPFMTIADVVNRDTAKAAATTDARTKRGFSFGKGGVGDKALVEELN